MNKRFMTISGAFALTFMLLFGGVAFAHATNTNKAKPKMSASEMPSARNDRRKHRRHRHHKHRNMYRGRHEMRREGKEKR